MDSSGLEGRSNEDRDDSAPDSGMIEWSSSYHWGSGGKVVSDTGIVGKGGHVHAKEG